MNILFLDQYNSLGGAQQCLLDLLPGIAECGWKAYVGIPSVGPLTERLNAMNIPVSAISCGSYHSARKTPGDFARYVWETPRLAMQIGTLARSLSIDLLYVNGPRILPAAAIAGRSRGIPCLFHCHVHLGQAAAIRAAGWALRYADATMVACCKFAAGPLSGYVKPDKRHVTYNGTRDLMLDATKTETRVGIIGRIEEDKGQMEFIEAARILHGEFPALRFIVAGAPLFSESTYFSRVRDASLGLPVEYLGWQDDVAGTLASLTVLVVPSAAHDPNPRVVLEAFSAGVPVVAFPSGGIPEIIQDGETGFLTTGRTAESLAQRIRDVLTMDPSSLGGVIGRARRAWEQFYQLDRYRGEIADCIRAAVISPSR
jgi:glycosyltransferase involved in cell wall biosynthesis